LTRHFKKTVKVTFFSKYEKKRKTRILEHCLHEETVGAIVGAIGRGDRLQQRSRHVNTP